MIHMDRDGHARPVVLMIEDCLDVLDLYALTIEPDVRVMKATRGETGFAVACAEHPDVIVLDLMLPDVDGWEICRRLKTTPQTRDIPVVVLTGSDSAEVDHRAATAGVVNVLRKPCPADALLRTLHAAVERQSAVAH